MRRTLQEQIQANKRASVFYALLMVLLLTALGTVLVGIWQPRSWYIGTAGALVLGVILVIVARTSGPDIMLSIAGAREATETEDRQLNNVVEEMAIAAGIPKPRVYVIDDESPNAFATGSGPDSGIVAITSGLMHKLDRDELQGVIAHEMGHIRNYDIRFMTTIGLIAGAIPLLADLILRSTWFGGGRRDRDRDNNMGAIFLVVGLVLAILAPIFALLLQMAVSRQREFLADSTAAELTRYPEGLARALQKISSDPDPLQSANRATQHMYIINPLHLNGGESSLFSTHPSTAERIRALMGLAGSQGRPTMATRTGPPPPIA